MSTWYKPTRLIQITDLFDGSLEKFGISEFVGKSTTRSRRCLTDGNNFLWVDEDPGGFTVGFTRYFPCGAPGRILAAVSKAFDTEIVSEYQPEFWGFETQEEWDACLDKLHEEDESRFYVEMMKYVRCESNSLGNRTVGMIRAKIAKTLITDKPSLGSPEKKRELLDAISEVYFRDHAYIRQFDEKDIARLKMLTTHEKDLPQA